MANTYTQILYHVVYSTKNREPAIRKEFREELYRYVWGIHKNLKCHLYRIGGARDHVHVLTSLPTSLALSTYIEKMKTGSTNWLRREKKDAAWPGWQDGYGAFTVSWREKDAVIEYIKDQDSHHQRFTFAEELRQLLEQAEVEFDERYLV